MVDQDLEYSLLETWLVWIIWDDFSHRFVSWFFFRFRIYGSFIENPIMLIVALELMADDTLTEDLKFLTNMTIIVTGKGVSWLYNQMELSFAQLSPASCFASFM